ncbi:hypothetical protein [Helicobacter cappadocius]|uniref:Uncharacterized protein n=1 Tax=Helicobacter cappadocius TaxID=3063998 RepID=A0AA90TB88_9HELI|nr:MULTISPECIES: hypothetical protein [unclassified Helicobacter]MDO7252698.1 hypothetical protein [Helicobacter sp. faydin-H75]MDP2538566.1 hypothetical protein [Helicobacter sp. faydin-H76]
MIKMFISKKEGSDLVRFNYKPKIKKSQIEKILGQDWEHKKLTKKQIKDFGLGFLLDVFGSSIECYFYNPLRSFYPEYCLGCFDINNKMMFYSRIYFPDEKKVRDVLLLDSSEELLDFYDFDSSNLSILEVNHLKNFKHNPYHFKVFRSKFLLPLRFSIQVCFSDTLLDVVLCQFDFDMEFDELSSLIELEEGEKRIKLLYKETLIRAKELYLFGAEHLLLLNQTDVKYFLVQNFK